MWFLSYPVCIRGVKVKREERKYIESYFQSLDALTPPQSIVIIYETPYKTISTLKHGSVQLLYQVEYS